MSQGFAKTPSYFSQVLLQDLNTLQFHGKLTLIQDVDNLLLCSLTKEVSIKDSIYLLKQLAEKEQKFSTKKLQLSLDTVNYLDHNLSTDGIQVSPKRINLIKEFSRPTTK